MFSVNNHSIKFDRKPTDSELAKFNNSDYWHWTDMTPSELAQVIQDGGWFRPGSNTKKDDCGYSTLIALDLDTGLTPNDSPVLDPNYGLHVNIRYQTHSSTPDSPKERLVFIFDQPITKADYVKFYEAVAKIAQVKNYDSACRNINRVFYGTHLPVQLITDTLNSTQFVKDTMNAPKLTVNLPSTNSQQQPSIGENPKNQAKRAKIKSDFLTPHEIVYTHVFDKVCNFDPLKLYCGGTLNFVHDFKPRELDAEGMVAKYQGHNPFSPTSASGTSFVIEYFENKLPVFFDRSRNFTNDYTGGAGGTFLRYWYEVSPTLKNNPYNEKLTLLDVLDYFGVTVPYQYELTFAVDYFDKNTKSVWNELTGSVYVNGQPVPPDMLCWFNRLWPFKEITKPSLVRDIVNSAARRHPYHPFIDYVENNYKNGILNPDLNWDKLPTALFNIPENAPGYHLHNKYLQVFLLGALARVYNPGIKFDTVLVLQGEQGIGKSSFFSRLFNRVEEFPFFGDSIQISDNKDNLLQLNTRVCWELAELNAKTSKKEVAEVRHFISQTESEVRRPYASNSERLKRSCVFGASVNEAEFLMDKEGNRRFMPIPASECVIITNQLANDIWRLAFHKYQELPTNRYELEEALSIPKDLREFQNQFNKDFEVYDVIIDSVSSVLSRMGDPEKVKLATVVYAITNEAVVSMSEQKRIANSLRTIGYERKKCWVDGKPEWYFVKKPVKNQAKTSVVSQNVQTQVETIQQKPEPKNDDIQPDADGTIFEGF